jgi:hypothetical protein
VANWYEVRDDEDAITALRAEGYRVTKEDFPEAIGNPTTPLELLRHFYARRQFYNPDRRFPDSINYKDGLDHVGGFLCRREKLGLSRAQAMKEATILIEMIFKYEEFFYLKTPIKEPSILTVDFVVRKACAFADGEVPVVNDAKTEAMVEELNQEYNREFAERDAREASERLARILEKLNVKK